MNSAIRSAFVFLMLATALFFIDLYGYFFLGSYVITGVIALYAVVITRPINPFRIALLLALSTIESFFFYGYGSLLLIITIPALIIAMRTRALFYNATVLSSLLVVGMLAVQSGIIEHYILNMHMPLIFTVSKLCINLLLTIMISLKY